ncbi:MAG: FAD-binding oxidoreductase [bacterium]|nr:FAD-binding oxidoreductase [bacterium]
MKNSKIFQEIGMIVDKEELNSTTAIVHVHSPNIAKHSIPGQFVHIRISDTFNPLLRRPFSIQNVIEQDNIELLIRSYGRGSSYLLQKKIGDEVNLLGPLGNGWSVPSRFKTIVGVSGGVGVAPILFLQNHFPENFIHILGAKTVGELPVSRKMIQQYDLKIATEDGSYGFYGNAIDLFLEYIQQLDVHSTFLVTCGPWKMMHELQKIAKNFNLSGAISAEARMGCAVGVCQGCAITLVTPSKLNSCFALCCKDGPIFTLEQINMEVNPFGN